MRTIELGVAITDAAINEKSTTIFCTPVARDRWCPDCGRDGRYRDTVTRPLTDLPVAGYPLVLRVAVPRYRCLTPECARASSTGSSTTSTATTEPGARCAGSTTRSQKPNSPSTGRPRSNATATSGSPGRPRASTVNWRPRPAPWPGGRATPPTSPASLRSSYRRLPPAVAHREELPDVQARRTGPAGLPPQA